MTLPRCPRSDLPRLLCACCDSFTMTDAEREYITPITRWGEPPSLTIIKPAERAHRSVIVGWHGPELPPKPEPTEQPRTVLEMLARLPDMAADALLTWNAPNPGLRAGKSRSTKRADAPAPTDLDALDALTPDGNGLLFQLHQAARAVTEECGLSEPSEYTWVAVCAWLSDNAVAWQCDRMLADWVATEVGHVYRVLSRLIRTPPVVRLRCPRVGCGSRAHMQPGGRWLVCDGGHTLDVKAERGRFLSMQDWTLTETRSALVTYLGREVPLNTLKTWAKRGKIRPVNDAQHPKRYNFGAVCRVAGAEGATRRERCS